MHATEFLQSTPADLPGVIALIGDERALKVRVETAITGVVLPDEDDAPTKLAGRDAVMKAVRDELLTVSMWGDRRVVIIEEAADFVSENRGALEKYAEKPAKKGMLILDVKSMPKNTRLYKTINKSGLVVECSELKGAALIGWIQNTAKDRFEKTIPRDAAGLLVELAGGSLGLIDQELSKLASYVGGQSQIDAEAVRRLVGGWKAKTTWAMTDAVRDNRLPDALEALDSLLDSGESPYRLVGGVAYVFRKLALATEIARQGLPLKTALKQAGAFPNEIDPASRYLRRIGRPQAERISDLLMTADSALKGGSRLSERAQLELLLVQLSGNAPAI